jgi:glutamate carboxypeptidase
MSGTPFTLSIALVVALSVSPPSIDAATLTAEERAIAQFIDTHRDSAIDLLARLVDINSGTMNPAGVQAVGEVLRAELDRLGFETRWIDQPPELERGGHLFGRRFDQDARSRGESVLLIGHLDTVFEPDSPFQRFERDGTIARGPGVADMKGGDVAIVYALKALDAVGALDGSDVTVAFLGDEESPGEPLSIARRDLIEAGQRVDVALGFETGVASDGIEYVTVARRSASEWRLEVTGRQGHSSGIFSERSGAGAIFEAARILSEFYETLRGEEYLTFNAGSFLGGTDVDYDFEHSRGSVYGKTNVIPRRVVVHGGIRAISEEQLERARERMEEVVARHLPVTSAEVTFSEGYPPMSPTEGNRRLMALYDQASRDLGLGALQALDPGRRGAADISFVAPFTDALAGLGLQGEGAHGPDESVDLESLTTQTKRAALLIYRLLGEGD